ncbi:pyruvate dehydrogenase complex dihydrolipoamide acetyltransferase [Parvularcula flava]|uniref:Acetyltransferase component of pyruvate dehydrogenase complex n=1 Tax=Aquisalinus luteolus TaxID=1566827 RepID=A0A8J3A3H4_9PROT|nr:pyruvate dehydrogenase complex dihydrolipoamide acetyltransferase [Aquisalinus luteolus]NHK27671.1 pyruvate dehydrogenase complex dihydrolipoamide acetyltransferase [Aquisalinus luteolus]GGH96146.1 acetyltransferase component of pyruvate dehydrogenase complex [Aquisalinus luteolus]
MPVPILMPALSPTMEEGTLAKWLVKEGDTVSSGDVIAEIETDKATMEVEAVDEGTIGKILIEEGSEGVKVNETIAVLLEEGESADDIDEASMKGGAASGGGDKAEKKEEEPKEEPKKEEAAAATPSTAPATPSKDAPKHNGRVHASPLAKRMAKNEGIELTALKGSGPHGRIVKRDIEKAMKDGTGKAGAAAPAAAGKAYQPPAAGIDERLYPADSYEAIKNDGMRKTIAKRLSQSFNGEVPHFPLNIDIDLDTLLEARERINAMSPPKGEEGFYKVSVNDFVIKASAMALKKVPAANATYTDDAILRHKHADVGVAVAIDGGLITPIIWKAETKGLLQISAEVRDLAGRARQKKLKPEEYMGGTFAVSNLGMFGIKSFSSIVSQPHGAIMSVGAAEERAVVRNGQIVIANQMTVTLTCDHRVVDGAVGAEYLSVFKKMIEEPTSMLL